MCLAIVNTVCFLMKTGPCKPTVIQQKAGWNYLLISKKQNALAASAFAELKKLSIGQGTIALASTAAIEQIPITVGTDLKVRYPDEEVSRWFEDGPDHD